MTTPGAEDAVRLSKPAEPAAPVVEQRLHPVTPFRRAWAPVAVLAGWAVHDPNAAQEQLTRLTSTTLLIAIAVVVPASALYGFLSWWFTHFSVTDTELRIRTGLVFRRTAHIRLERVQAIDVSQPLLARVAGVAKLRLDVIGTDDKDELAFLGEREARALRAELLARAAGFAPETAQQVGEAPTRELL
ncbi:PH domain-containing protein, partial [Streptomyces sp. S6]